MLLSLGSNGSGQLGLGHQDDVDRPSRVNLSSLKDKVKDIAAGGNHTLLLTTDSRLYSVGENRDGRCARLQIEADGSDDSSQFLPIKNIEKVDLYIHWKLVSATWEASTLVSDADRVYSCGTGNKGELGLGDAILTASDPVLMQGFPPPGLLVDHIVASMGHTVAVLSDGSVYGWGNGRKGQLGQPATVCWSPRRIEGVSFKAVHAACGRDFTVIAGSADAGHFVVLGSDRWGARSGAPSTIAGWKHVRATWSSVFVLLQSGNLLSWGRNDHGQLGPNDRPPLKELAAGSEHVLALSTTGEVLAWGWGEHGNCGQPTDSNGDVKDRSNSLPLPSPCTRVAAGCATSWILCND